MKEPGDEEPSPLVYTPEEDSLPDDATRERRDAAIANAARAYVQALRARDELAMARGSLAVGDAAWFPGHRLGSPEAIARYYDELAARGGD